MKNHQSMLLPKSNEVKNMLGENDDVRWPTALSILEQGDCNGAARLVLEILNDSDFKLSPPRQSGLSKKDVLEQLTKDFSTQLSSFIPSMVIGAIMNLAYFKNSFGGDTLKMTAKAVDVGLTGFAYNVANKLYETASCPADYEKSEHYYRIAIEYADNDSSKAAALVNYCPIVRDGMITGKRDLIKAIEIYEEAAKLGLVIGMFNTANVCQWLEEPEKSAYRGKALHWLNEAVSHVTSNKKLLDMDSPESCQQILNTARLMIGSIHATPEFKEANLEAGIAALKDFVPTNTNEELGKAWHLERAYSQRIVELGKPQINTPANRWKLILDAIDWKTSTPQGLDDLGEFFYASTGDQSEDNIAIFVSSTFFEPGKPNSLLDNLMLTNFADNNKTIIAFSPFGVFKSKGQGSFVAATVIHNETVSLVAIRAGMTPAQVVKNAKDHVDFYDLRYGSCSCALPIAVNKLMTDAAVNENFNYEAPFITAGEWNIPWEADISLLSKMKRIV